MTEKRCRKVVDEKRLTVCFVLIFDTINKRILRHQKTLNTYGYIRNIKKNKQSIN
jgi:hypothetical protein